MNQLNRPIKINSLELPNRLVMPPMATAKSDGDGQVTQQLCDYYAEKSAGNYIGLIITEHAYISPEGKAKQGQLSIARDEDVEGLKKLVLSVHQNGTKVMAQLNHAGGAAKYEVTGYPPMSASAVEMPNAAPGSSLPTAMTTDDIQKVTDNFVKAAIRAKEAGFDGVEIHSAHGYLLNQFYSPLTNKRTDGYSGSTLQGRIKLHLEIIRAVRNALGADYPIALRLGACDYKDNGSTIEDSVLAAKAFEEAGLDLLDISGGFCGYIHPFKQEQGYFSEITEAIKANCSIPVLLTGGIVDARAAEALLQSGKADLIGVGRAVLRDSGWARREMCAE